MSTIRGTGDRRYLVSLEEEREKREKGRRGRSLYTFYCFKK